MGYLAYSKGTLIVGIYSLQTLRDDFRTLLKEESHSSK